MAHSSATGLADDWRIRIMSPHGTPSPPPQPPLFKFETPGRNILSQSSMSMMSTATVSTPSPLNVWNSIFYLLFHLLIERLELSLGRLLRSKPTSSRESLGARRVTQESRISRSIFVRTSATNSFVSSSEKSLIHGHLGSTQMSHRFRPHMK